MSSNLGPLNTMLPEDYSYVVECGWKPVYDEDGLVKDESGFLAWRSKNGSFSFERSGRGDFSPSYDIVQAIVDSLRKYGNVYFKEFFPDGSVEEQVYKKEETTVAVEA